MLKRGVQILFLLYFFGMAVSCAIMKDSIAEAVFSGPWWLKCVCILPLALFAIISAIDALVSTFDIDLGPGRPSHSESESEKTVSQPRKAVQEEWWRKYY